MSEYETVNVHREGAAATIELNRPETLNAWNAQLGHDLLAAVTAVAEDDGVRAVVITGAGRAFSAGADLRDLSGREDRTPEGQPSPNCACAAGRSLSDPASQPSYGSWLPIGSALRKERPKSRGRRSETTSPLRRRFLRPQLHF
jgi:hypothetical protein